MHNQIIETIISKQIAILQSKPQSETWVLKNQPDEIRAGHYLSRNWVKINWWDAVGYPSAIHQKIAKMDFNENRASIKFSNFFQ